MEELIERWNPPTVECPEHHVEQPASKLVQRCKVQVGTSKRCPVTSHGEQFHSEDQCDICGRTLIKVRQECGLQLKEPKKTKGPIGLRRLRFSVENDW